MKTSALCRNGRPVCAPRASASRHRVLPTPTRSVRIDFGDGEAVMVRIRGQPDMCDMLRSVNAAGLRRRAANGFPVNDSVLFRTHDDLNEEHEYMVWPKPKKHEEDRRVPI
nr:hypothetical protein TetV2_00165 [Oceanusvirus sp.]